MEITRKSMVTGRVHTMDLQVTPAELARWEAGGILLQDAFPRLTPGEREFIKTGITPEEWDAMFPPDDDDDDDI